MDPRPIGVFDSGLGGLTAVRQLLARLPRERIIYFGDTGRVPYGTRGDAVIEKYAAEDSRFLLRREVKLIIAACGTVSSVAPHVLAGLPVPAIGVVEPAAKAAAAATKNGRIGVIGTAATIRSRSFAKRVEQIDPALQVVSQACPLFVPLVENGWIDPADEVTRLTAARYLTPLKENGVDTLIMGCTHFPLLKPHLAAVLGDRVTLIDAGEEAARACESILREQDALGATDAQGGCEFYVTDRPQNFLSVAEMFLGRTVRQDVEVVDLASL
ncbi:MAG: glutamate racemase [Clostridia bacterium]|nr:glutamate racemase [Clostridia bacterium]